MSTATIVATLDHPPASPAKLAELCGRAHVLEVRAELAGDLDPAFLRNHFDGELLYSLAGDENRRPRIRRAARDYDLIALEQRDLSPSLLAAIPESKRILVAHAVPQDQLALRLAQLSATPARLYLLTVEAKQPGDALAPLQLLHALRRRDVTAFATGPGGLWTRVVAPWLGAPVVFGGLDDGDRAGLPSVTRLIESFGFPDLPEIEELFGMVGSPVLHSLSPRVHNSAFRATGRRALYVPFHVDDFGDFWRNVIESEATDALGLPIRGLSIVSPHKALAVGAVQSRSPMVQRAASTNFVVRREGGWSAETTDADGVLLTLRDRGINCRNKRVAVVGCGGSGRVMAAALHHAGADVTLVNRGFERGSLAVRLLHLPFTPLTGFSAAPFSIVVNATPVGREGDDLPFAIDHLSRDAVVVDLVYRDQPTTLITRTRGPGRITIDGWDMLVTQAARQFDLMTGTEMPDGLARQALGLAEPVAAGAEC